MLEHIDLDDPGSVGQLVAACLASAALRRARAADECRREVPYTLRSGDGFETGRIAVVFREGSSLVVIDWKTDTVTPGQVAAAAEGHRAPGEHGIRPKAAA